MPDLEVPPPPADPLEWAPMRLYAGRRTFEITDPVVEPFWSGTRVLAHVTVAPGAAAPAQIHLVEGLGADLAPELPAVTRALNEGVLAREAIIDGVISRQLALDGVGAAAIPEVRGRPAQMFVRSGIDFDVPSPAAEEIAAAELVDGFVAVDLLRIDGSSLLDLPLLERKRLLESVIAPGPLLRLSGFVRPPVDPWVATWKSIGLVGGMLKAANSRYHPSADTVEWRAVRRLGGRR